MRLDVLLVERGIFQSRERARAAIMSGEVFVAGVRVDKAGASVPEDAEVEFRGRAIPYVSRGGLKLEKALEVFPVKLNGVRAADVGASTGGFTDCMLRNGAAKVYAIDVGYGQLAWSLRTDERVVVMERTNIRNVTPEMIGEPLDFASIDVSFISLRIVLPCVKPLLREGGEVVALVKPQFEAGREKVGKKGVVRDPETHLEVLEAFLTHAHDAGFAVKGLDFSPVRGPEGNIEYLAYLSCEGESGDFDLKRLVESSHAALDGRESER